MIQTPHLGGLPQAAAPAPLAQSAGVTPAQLQPQAPAVTAPATPEVAQIAAPAGFNIMNYAVHKALATKSTARTPYWECSIEELRTRISFRDVQAVTNKNPDEYHCRIFLSPKPIEMATVLKQDAAGNDINTVIVPANLREVTEAHLREYVSQGVFDQALLDCAAASKKAAEERANTPKRAPVDKASADAALAELEQAGQVLAQSPQMAAPVAAAPQMAAPAPVATAGALPAGMVQPQALAQPQLQPVAQPGGVVMPQFPSA